MFNGIDSGKSQEAPLYKQSGNTNIMTALIFLSISLSYIENLVINTKMTEWKISSLKFNKLKIVAHPRTDTSDDESSFRVNMIYLLKV